MRRSAAAGVVLAAAIGKHGPTAGAAPALPAGQPAPLLARSYAIATENSANYGVALDRADQGLACGAFNGGGFVYSGMWQGVENGEPDWVEAGSSKCDVNASDVKWVAAARIDGVYTETFLQNGDLNRSHNWKITAQDGRWKLYIDGQLRHDYGPKTYTNASSTADVGLEVLDRPNAEMPPTVDDNLMAFVGPENGWQPWSGRDSCSAGLPAKGSWSDSNTWKFAYRHDLQGGAPCT